MRRTRATTVAARVPALAAALALAVCTACAPARPEPIAIDTRNDACSWCRMAISDPRFAAQLVAPSMEPRLFDDIGCLRDYLTGGAQVPEGAAAFVADHGTRAWVPAARAVYRQVENRATPMGSGLVAWADDTTRTADPDGGTGIPRAARDVFGPAGPPGGASGAGGAREGA